uniref:Putative disease resistance RPP13-like protein 2 n=1 Tax=Aegilops tauschii TaxID=37682 RepID=M8BZY5_AEGTA
MGRGVTEGGIVKDMKRILSLGYYDLPAHLKTCLLYLSIFPEDLEIKRDWLIWRWLAEGFIQRDKKESELMNRSLLQPAYINKEGTVVTFRIHDMVLDLICSLSSEENFISILYNDEWHAPNLQRKFRRLSLHNIKAKVQNHQFESTSLSKVRTFAVFSPVTCDWLPSLSSFQFLRVLDLGNCGGHESSSGISLKLPSYPHLFKELGHLTELRTLYIICDGMDKDLSNILAESLGNLQKLQNLNIGNGGSVIDRMREIWVPPPHLRSFESWHGLFLRLPKWVNSRSLPHLSTLRIEVEELQADDFQIIGMLPALRCLELGAHRLMETLVVSADAFPYATSCKFERFLSPPSLFPPGAMSRVEHLQFEVSAPSIANGELDCGLGHLPSLEYVKVILRIGKSSVEDKETAKAWLRRAAEAHPNCPTIEFELLIARGDQRL